MRRTVKGGLGVVAVLILVAMAALSSTRMRSFGHRITFDPPLHATERAVVRIASVGFAAGAEPVVIRAEIARTDVERTRGLSGRASLADGAGMLFLFDQLDHHQVWMRGMRFAIDCIWIAGGVVVDTTMGLPVPARDQRELPVFQPAYPALLVLEVPAGTVARHSIRRGDRVSIAFDGW